MNTLNNDSLFSAREEIEINATLNASPDPMALKLSNLINFTPSPKPVMSNYDVWQYVYLCRDLGMSDKAQTHIHDTLMEKYL